MSDIIQGQSERGTFDVVQMAEHFFGYGRWDAPYWFLGPEAGMSKDGIDSLSVRYKSWKQLGCASVVDCEKHHRGFRFTKWHDPPPKHKLPTQSTWRQLIRLLLAYKGMSPTLDDIRAYQQCHWGSENGETCVIELSGIPAPNMQVQRDRETFLLRRIEQLRQKALIHRPKFIVMYGTGQREEWKRIVGGDFDTGGIRRMEGTVAVVASHPVSHGTSNEYWVELGQRLRAALDEP